LTHGRVRAGWGLTVMGAVLIFWGVLHMTGSTVGGRVHEVSERRTYNETKRAAQSAFPGFLWRSLAGVALIIVGSRIRAHAGKPASD
jgi:hypothetical protein